MCLIISADTGVSIPSELIESTFYSGNNDGWGVSAYNPLTDEFKVHKGTQLNSLHWCLEELDNTWDRVVHLRMATRGKVSEDNIHPFEVGNERLRCVMHHNGTIFKFAPDKEDDRSDTNLFAKWMREQITIEDPSILMREEIQKLLVQITNSQLAFHYEDGTKLLMGSDEWVELDGLKLSNTYAWAYYGYYCGYTSRDYSDYVSPYTKGTYVWDDKTNAYKLLPPKTEDPKQVDINLNIRETV